METTNRIMHMELLIIVAIIAVLLAMAAPPVWKAKKKAQELKEQAEKRSDQVDKEYLNRDKERTLNATDESSRDGGLILEARERFLLKEAGLCHRLRGCDRWT